MSQRRRAFSGLLNLLEIAPLRVVVRVRGEQQFGVAEDRRQQVVEIVGDAAGQPADAVDLLRLHDALFERAPVRDVARDAEMAAAVDARAVGAVDDAPPAAIAAHAVLAVRFAERQKLAPCVGELPVVVHEQRVERLLNDLFGGEAKQGARRRVRLEHLPTGVENQHRVDGVEEDRAELPIALERGLRGDARRRVEQKPAQLDQPRPVELADDGFNHVRHAAVAAPQPRAVVLETAALTDGRDEAIALRSIVVHRRHRAGHRVGDG